MSIASPYRSLRFDGLFVTQAAAAAYDAEAIRVFKDDHPPLNFPVRPSTQDADAVAHAARFKLRWMRPFTCPYMACVKRVHTRYRSVLCTASFFGSYTSWADQ